MLGHKEIGKRIEYARKLRGLTLNQLAEAVGVAASTIQRYEKGNFQKIKLPIIESIAERLDVDPLWITGRSGNISGHKQFKVLKEFAIRLSKAVEKDPDFVKKQNMDDLMIKLGFNSDEINLLINPEVVRNCDIPDDLDDK